MDWVEMILGSCILPGLGMFLGANLQKWVDKGKNKRETLYLLGALVMTVVWFYWQFTKISQAKDNFLTVNDVINIAAMVSTLTAIPIMLVVGILVIWLRKYIGEHYVRKENYDALFSILEKITAVIDKYHPIDNTKE
nr:MAG TPA: hypothetical protein [Caudoviricetes sp.]